MSPDLLRQTEYASRMKSAGFDFSAVVMGAVVNGMRDLGYKSMATALDELVDNAIQAEATRIDVYLGGDTKPSQIVVIDNGHGMEPVMLRLAAVWGAGHHHDDSAGFGKYGYGLPSASVSMGKRFTIYSKVSVGKWHQVSVDLEKIETGEYAFGKPVQVEEPVVTDLPPAVSSYIQDHYKEGLDQGTVVVIDKLDRLTWKTTKTIERNLLEHFGLIYRNYLRSSNIHVQGKGVKAVDPLFLTPGAQFFDIDDERAEALPPISFAVVNQQSREVEGEVRVRFASMPAGFARVPSDKGKIKGGRSNARFQVLDENNGIVVCRQGRQIDVVRSKRDKEIGIAFSVNNDDRYWGVEIDFDPSLDDEFSITTSKQQVSLSERMWKLLIEHNVMAAIQDLRKRYDEMTRTLNHTTRNSPGEKPPAKAMRESQRFMPPPPPSRIAEGEARLHKEAEELSMETGVDVEAVLPKVREGAADRFKVVTEAMRASAAFYEPEQLGGQTRVILNERHSFFTMLYASASEETREAIDLILFTLAEGELNSTEDTRRTYEMERGVWSQRIKAAIEQYDTIVSMPTPTNDEPIIVKPDSAMSV